MDSHENQGGSRFADFARKIEEGISDLVTLDIKTIVGEFDVNAENEVFPRSGDDFKVITSRIDLIGGDITTRISNELVYDKYNWLRDFHARKEEKGHEIIAGNIEAIKSIMKLFQDTEGSQGE